MSTLTTDILETLRQRRSAGESIKALACEAGLSWQRLWSLLYPTPSQLPVVRTNPGAGCLTEKYRPLALDALWGQEQVVKILRKFAESPYPTAFIFEGETGTGKTSAALSLAAALGCDLSQKPQEYGGVQSIASGEQSADAVREAYRQMHNCPWSGSGWKVVIVNEADRMARPAETIWLDVLEAIPKKTVIVFTTNEAARLSQRFLDRCTRLVFESDAQKLRESAIAFASAVWKQETGRRADSQAIAKLVDSCQAAGQISFRRVVQELTVALGLEGGL